MLAYRAGFVSNLIGSIVWGAFHYVAMFLLTYRVNSVYGWSRPELLLLTGTFGVMWGLFRLIFIRNFHEFSHVILSGRLDGILLKPADAQFLMSSMRVSYDEVVRVIVGLGFSIYIVHSYNMPVTLPSIIMYCILIAFGLLISYATWYTVCSIAFWFPRLDNIIGLLYSTAGTMKYPPEVLSKLGGVGVFLLTPLFFVITPPTKALVQKLSIAQGIWFIASAILLFILCRLFWLRALKEYTSVNS